MSDREFKSPDSNWIVRSLLSGDLSIRDSDGMDPIEVDDFTLESLRRILHGTRAPGSFTVLGPDCNIPLLPVAAAAVAYHMDDMGITQESVVYAYSRDRPSRYLLDSIGYRTLPSGPLTNHFPVATISERMRNLSRSIMRKDFARKPRIIFSDSLDTVVIMRMVEAKFQPRVVLIDGRTLGPFQFDMLTELRDLLRKTSFIMISPSPYLEAPGFPRPRDGPGKTGSPKKSLGGRPLLVNKAPRPHRLNRIELTLDTDSCMDSLRHLNSEGHPLMDEFRRQGWSLFRTLLAVPVQPREINRAWNMRDNMLEHPIRSSLSRIEDIARRSLVQDPEISAIMNIAVHELDQLNGRLDSVSPKRDMLLKTVDNNESWTILVDRTATARAVESVLRPLNKDVNARSWYDPPTWAPADSGILICCPPPYGREWMTNVPLGGDVTFLLYPQEAALMAHRFRKIGMDKGIAWNTLVSMTARNKELIIGPEEPRMAEDLELLLDGLEESPTINPRMKFEYGSGSSAESVTVIPMNLKGGGIFWARELSEITVYRDGRLIYLRPGELEENDLIMVPKNSPDSEILEAFFDAVESKGGNERCVRIVRTWKHDLQDYMKDNELSFRILSAILNALGANVNDGQIRNMLSYDGGREKQISVLDQERLIVASFKMLGKEFNNEDVMDLSTSISRIRGLHHSAGKMLRKMASSAFINYDTELNSRVENEFGLTLGDLRDQVEIHVVQSISPREQVPPGLAGRLEVAEEE
jgi:hypothetical protein